MKFWNVLKISSNILYYHNISNLVLTFKFDRIIFCLFMDVDISLYEQNLSEKFPVVKQQQCRVVRSTVEPPKAKKPEEPVLKISPESKTKSSGDL